jgi:peptide/nickel transport system permease protein
MTETLRARQAVPAPVSGVRALLKSPWGAFALRRLGGLVLSLALLILLTFLIVPLIPGDPAIAILGPGATAESIAIMREKLHLDVPLWEQFGIYLQGLGSLDLGTSFRYSTPVLTTIFT